VINPVKESPSAAQVRWTSPRITVVLAVLFAVVLTFASVCPLSSPDGAYYDPYVGCIGDAYWVFEKGQFSLRTPESNELISTYSKQGGQWVFRDVRGREEQFGFTATMLGIRLHDPSIQNRFLFRRSFGWLPKSWTWVQLHRFW